MIVLVSSIEDLENFGVLLSKEAWSFVQENWAGAVSVVLPFEKEEMKYLSGGGNTIAFRMPDKKDLLDLLEKTGPLIAPSANPEGLSPAKNIEEARMYFGDSVDFYEDEGEIENTKGSTLVEIVGGEVRVLREGCKKF